MKINNLLRFAGLLALALTVAVGCASAPEQPKVSGPTAEQAQAAIASAKEAYKRALAADAAWNTTAPLIKKAEGLEAKGDYAGAIKLADEARTQSENALAQHAEQMARLKAAAASAAHSASMKADSYKVMRGDSLWRISGKDDMYGNPYEWPLIYKANQDKIKDADLIYPGQVFKIKRDASQAEVDAAIHHAKTRGKWTLGVVPASDKAYLAQ